MKNRSFGRKTILFSCIVIVALLISSATAVSQTHGAVAVKKLNEAKQANDFSKSVTQIVDKETDHSKLSSLLKGDGLRNKKEYTYLTNELKNILSRTDMGKSFLKEKSLPLALQFSVLAENLILYIENPKLQLSKLSIGDIQEETNDLLKDGVSKNDVMIKAQDSLDRVYRAANELLIRKDLTQDERSLLETAMSCIVVFKDALDDLVSDKPNVKLFKNKVTNALSDYESKLQGILSVGDINWSKILKILIITILLIILIPMLIILSPLLIVLAGILIGGAVIGIILAIIGIIGIILGIVGLIIVGVIVAILLVPVIFAIIVVILALVLIVTIAICAALPVLGVIVAGLGILLGGIIAAFPIFLPILLILVLVKGEDIWNSLIDISPDLEDKVRSFLDTIETNFPSLAEFLKNLFSYLPWD